MSVTEEFVLDFRLDEVKPILGRENDMHVTAVDKNEKYVRYAHLNENMSIFITDPSKQEFYSSMEEAGKSFDFIIDTGSYPEDTLKTYENLYPLLVTGGYYFMVVENVEMFDTLTNLHGQHISKSFEIRCNGKLLIIKK